MSQVMSSLSDAEGDKRQRHRVYCSQERNASPVTCIKVLIELPKPIRVRSRQNGLISIRYLVY